MADLAKMFAASFKQAGGYSPAVYSNLIRFLAVMVVLFAIAFTINAFLSDEAKSSESYIAKLGIRGFLAITGLIFFLICLTV